MVHQVVSTSVGPNPPVLVLRFPMENVLLVFLIHMLVRTVYHEPISGYFYLS